LTDTYTDTADLPADDGPLPFSGTEEGLRDAAEEVGRRRAAAAQTRPELPEEETGEDSDVDKIRYLDPEKAKTAKSVSEVAKDYSAYREERAKEVLAQIQADWDQQRLEGLDAKQLHENQEQVEQTEQPKSEQQQLAEWYESLEPPAKLQVQAAAQYEQQAVAANQAATTHFLALSDLVGRLNGVGAQAFADIRTEGDIQKLAQQDPACFQQLQTHVATLQAVSAEAQKIQQQQQADYQQWFQTQFDQWAEQQEKKISQSQLIPELSNKADKTVQREFQRDALALLKESGFTEAELSAGWWRGEGFQIRDSRVQKLISDATRYRAIQNSRKDLANHRKPPSPVMRPGRAQDTYYSRGHVQQLESELSKTHSVDSAVKLLQARRAAQR